MIYNYFTYPLLAIIFFVFLSNYKNYYKANVYLLLFFLIVTFFAIDLSSKGSLFFLILFLISNFILDISTYLVKQNEKIKYDMVHPLVYFFKLFLIVGIGISLLFKIDLSSDLLNSILVNDGLVFITSKLELWDMSIIIFSFLVIFLALQERDKL